MIQRPRNKASVAILCGALCLAVPIVAGRQSAARGRTLRPVLRDVIWHEPGNPAALDLFYGAGGARDAPHAKDRFRFLKEDLKQHNPKFDVLDDRGRTWRIKLGNEVHPETAATRLLWAAGYFVDEDYFLAEMKVEGLPRLQRGREFVSSGGIIYGAEMELRREDTKKQGDWSWFQNPFQGTREFNGLRVMMCLLNNWDLAANNNSIYETNGERRFLVGDVGASFGKTGNSYARTKGVLNDYAHSRFVEHESGEEADFVMHSRPFFLAAFNVGNYRKRTRMERIGKHIPVEDARWLGHVLGRLSAEQLRACFRGAGYDEATASGYADAVRERIEELNRL